MFQLIVSGVATGCIYALVALGFIIIYNAVGAINFAQGDFVMAGGYVGAWGSATLGLPLWVAFAFTLVLMGVFGLVFQRLLYTPLHERPVVAFLVASIGAGIVMRNAALVLFGPEPRSIGPLLGGGSLELFGGRLSNSYVAVVVITVVALGALYVLLTHTVFGKSLRATAQDAGMARLVGVRVRRMIAFTFLISAVLSAIAGFLLAPIVFVYPEVGLSLIVSAFIAAVIGGFGSLPGAIVGGILVGVAQVLIASYISSQWTQVILFGVLMALLMFYPRGIFGETISEKV